MLYYIVFGRRSLSFLKIRTCVRRKNIMTSIIMFSTVFHSALLSSILYVFNSGEICALRLTSNEDHRAFLGKMKEEFDMLPLEEAKRRLRLLIPHVDINKDGFVSKKELSMWVRDRYTSLLETEDIDSVFREADVDWTNQVTWAEYVWRHFGFRYNISNGFTEMLKKEYAEYLSRDKRRWKYADTDKNGVLNLEEFHMFSKPSKYSEMMDVVAMEELEHADTNNDGYLSMEEYISSIHMPYMRGLDEEKFREQYDQNKDERLNVEEVKVWKTPELYDKAELEAKHLIDIADGNQDGLLTTDEIILHHFVFVGSKVTMSGQILHDEF